MISLRLAIVNVRNVFGTKIDGQGLRARTLRGGAFLGIGNVAEQLLRFGRNILLTRLLAPEVFGTMAIVLSISSAIESFTEIGVKEAVIQNPNGSDRRYINAAWWLAFGRALSMYAVIFAAAPFVAQFYKRPELAGLLRIALLSVLFIGCMSSGSFRVLKEMKFRDWAIVWHGGGIIGITATIVFAVVIRSVWALILGFVAESAAKCVISYILCPFRPRLPVDKRCGSELLRFSRRVFGLPLLNFIFMRTDIFVLGRMKSATVLGLYAMGIYLAQVPIGFFMNLLGQILLPALSALQGNRERVKRTFLGITLVLASVTLPLLVFAFAYGKSLLTVVYGQSYSTVALAFSLAAAMSVLNIVNGQITIVFYASGDPQLHRRSVFLTAATMALLVYPFVGRFGLVGAPLASLLAITVGYLFQLIRLVPLLGLNLVDYFKCFLPGAGGALIVLVYYLGTSPLLEASMPRPNLASGIFACALSYAVFLAFAICRKNAAKFLETPAS